jgi:hypothetical protein
MQTTIESGAAMNNQEVTPVEDARAGEEPSAPASRVVVGVSASRSGLAALRVAVHEAVARNATLHLVRVWRDVGWLFSMTAADIMGMRDRERADGLVLALAVEAAHAIDPFVHEPFSATRRTSIAQRCSLAASLFPRSRARTLFFSALDGYSSPPTARARSAC